MPKVNMFVGMPGSGKSNYTKTLTGYTILNRDTIGKDLSRLVPRMVEVIKSGQNVCLDNTNPTIESRAPFIKAAHDAGADVTITWFKTAPEDCQINVMFRMLERYGKLFFDIDQLKEVDKDPNMMAPHVLFHFKKIFQPPTEDEGCKINVIPFVRQYPKDFVNKALLLDYDGTLRETVGGNEKWPTAPDQIRIKPDRNRIISQYKKEGYKILGVSNQSAIAKGTLTIEEATECFEHTNKLLGHDIEYVFCQHKSAPISCYCRKPQSGFGVHFIWKHKLNPKECIMVGDITTDRTFATRLGFQYFDQAEFFK